MSNASELPPKKAVREQLSFGSNGHLAQMFGPGSGYLKLIAKELGIQISSRGNEVTVSGPAEQVEQAKALLQQLYSLVRRGREFDEEDIRRAVGVIQGQSSLSVRSVFADRLLVTPGATIKPKGLAQKRYVDAIREHDIVFGVGPAGTGKTYLAMAMAVAALTENRIKRIILTRPAVEAGEKLGFLPGDLTEKVNPYLRPLYDALHDMLEIDRTQAMLARGQIEVAPLAFMRGRTLNSSFVILDEAQNTTSEQMMMFLTRLGYDSSAVITGDVTQVDLPSGQRSGLSEAVELLEEIEGISLCRFTERDVVRHPLVQKIIKAYALRRPSSSRDESPATPGEESPD